MRAVLVIVLLLVVIGAGAYLLFGGPGVESAPMQEGAGAHAVLGGRGGDAVRGLPEGIVATRVDPPEIPAGPLADEPTACLRVVDHLTGAPLAGAIVRHVQSGADLGFSDERGLVPLPLDKAAQLAVILDGYLMRRAPTRLGSDEQSPQVVRLVPDRWSLVRRFAFVGPDGAVPEQVLVRLRPARDLPATRSPVPTSDTVARRAWDEHARLAAGAVARDVAVQLGTYSVDRVHRLAGDAGIVKFVTPGDYVLEAATVTGLVGVAQVSVQPGPWPPTQRILLRLGDFVSGEVTGLDGAPLADAELTVQGGEPLGLVARTSDDGAFALGPLGAAEVTLLVRHGTHAPAAHGPVPASADDVVVRLRPLATSGIRGRVRARPEGTPIEGAVVVWQVAGGAAVRTTTAADGTFTLQAPGEVASQLLVQAPGFVPYAELVDPGAPFADYDLLPAEPRVRVAKGLTAMLEGVVLGANGWPEARASVRWEPSNAAAPVVSPGRRILRGGAPSLLGVTTTKENGAFAIETDRFGPGRLILGRGDDAVSIEVTAVAGRSTSGLELRR